MYFWLQHYLQYTTDKEPQRDGNTRPLVSWEACLRVKKQKLEPDMEQQTGSKQGKEYDKAIYCHPAYLTYMQNILCEMPGWKNHKREQDCQEKYQQPQICRWYNSNDKKWKGTGLTKRQTRLNDWTELKRNQKASWWRWKKRVKKLA